MGLWGRETNPTRIKKIVARAQEMAYSKVKTVWESVEGPKLKVTWIDLN